MLILTRRVSEILKIGDDISVRVLGVKGNQVRLGIVAPKNVAVHREEIWLQIRAGAPDSKRGVPETNGVPVIVMKPQRKRPTA